ncbi:hypothetical protein TrVE_jg11362 [Triparma verrucosa]|uniref:Uncharacterized protein n=1 Tax=Triparma verrucosa TaxID=1606542 RepID=A0A9W7BCD1_9STRA|nr:hypothetical protein TrVE_jg11362 [Triparma verrucosa]
MGRGRRILVAIFVTVSVCSLHDVGAFSPSNLVLVVPHRSKQVSTRAATREPDQRTWEVDRKNGKDWFEDELSVLSAELQTVEENLLMLKKEKKKLKKRQKDLSSIYDELRFEVQNAGLNGPILALISGAAVISLLWKDVLVVSSLYLNNEWMEADWGEEAINLLGRLPVDLLRQYSAYVIAAPVLTKAFTSCASYLAGDLTAQFVEGRRRVKLLDLKRASRNGLLGFFLHGPLLHFWILFLENGPVLDVIPDGGPPLLLAKIALDQTFFTVVINLAYATLDGLLMDLSPSDSFTRAREVLVPSVVQSWKFWPFVHLISYSPLIPVDLKLLWIDVMEVVWVAILSSTVNSGEGGGKGGEDADASISAGSVGVPVPWGEGRFVKEDELQRELELLEEEK